MCTGNTRVPVDLLTDSKISKAEKEERRKGEIDYGPRTFKMPRTLHGNREAQKKWKKVVKLYLDSDLAIVGSADEETLERYCLTYANYYKLLDARKKIEVKHKDDPEAFLTALTKTKVDTLIKQNLDSLLKLDAVLLLNPLAKIHTRPVPRVHRKVQDEKQDASDKFDGL